MHAMATGVMPAPAEPRVSMESEPSPSIGPVGTACAETEASQTSKALARLARKAESARQARLRHKDSVYRIQDDIQALQHHAMHLEAQRAAWQSQLRGELRAALPVERWQVVEGWLREGEARQAAAAYAAGQQQQLAAAAAAAAAAGAPLPIGQPLTRSQEHAPVSGEGPSITSSSALHRHHPPLPDIARALSSDEAMEQPELLLCALSMASPAFGPTGVPLSRSLPSRRAPLMASIPANARAQAHAVAARSRRAAAAAVARQSAPKPSGGALGLKNIDLLEAVASELASPDTNGGSRSESGSDDSARWLKHDAIQPKAHGVSATPYTITPSPTSVMNDDMPHAAAAAALGLFGLAATVP